MEGDLDEEGWLPGGDGVPVLPELPVLGDPGSRDLSGQLVRPEVEVGDQSQGPVNRVRGDRDVEEEVTCHMQGEDVVATLEAEEVLVVLEVGMVGHLVCEGGVHRVSDLGDGDLSCLAILLDLGILGHQVMLV